jgi:hypothetical protein
VSGKPISDEAREAAADFIRQAPLGLQVMVDGTTSAMLVNIIGRAIDAAEKRGEMRGRAKGLREAAGMVSRFERPRMDADDYTFIREASAAILKLENEGEDHPGSQ